MGGCAWSVKDNRKVKTGKQDTTTCYCCMFVGVSRFCFSMLYDIRCYMIFDFMDGDSAVVCTLLGRTMLPVVSVLMSAGVGISVDVDVARPCFGVASTSMLAVVLCCHRLRTSKYLFR